MNVAFEYGYFTPDSLVGPEGRVVFASAGMSAEEAEDTLWGTLGSDGVFVADQLGIPERAPWAPTPSAWRPGIDVCEHALLCVRSTEEAATDPRLIEQFLAEVRQARATGWWRFVIRAGARDYACRLPVLERGAFAADDGIAA
jgi:hypothetical protein